MAIAVGLLLLSELELLLELLLVLREFVTTLPSGVCSSTRSANLTFFLAGSGAESRPVIRRFQSQSRMLAPDTSVRVPVPRQSH